MNYFALNVRLHSLSSFVTQDKASAARRLRTEREDREREREKRMREGWKKKRKKIGRG